MIGDPEIILPEWPAPPTVRAAATTRLGGISEPPFDSLNLGVRTGDRLDHVDENRRRLADALNLPEQPRWLHQVHGRRAIPAAGADRDAVEADAAWTAEPGVVCAIQTADCLPVLLCDDRGERVAVAHAGWRGLASGVLEAAVQALNVPGENLMAWLGPAIGPSAFEVGDEVRQAFLQADPGAGVAFEPSTGGRWLADLYSLARRRLAAAGVSHVHGGGWCTFSDAGRFYSYRRDRRTGRMASLIWLEA